MRESVVEQHLVDSVKALGGMAPKFKSPGRNNVPDRLVLLPGGRVVFVECKAPGETVTEAQKREINRLINLGFVVLVIDSKGSVDQWLGYPGLV